MLSFFKPVLRVIALIWVVLLSMVTVSFAQGRTGDLTGNIPFPFMVAGKTLPAGQYTITPVGETVFRIQGAGNVGVLVQTRSTERKEPASVARMIFRRRRDTYVLSEFWIAGNRIGRQLFMPAGEKATSTHEPEEIALVLARGK